MRHLVVALAATFASTVVVALAVWRTLRGWRANSYEARLARLPQLIRDRTIGTCDACGNSSAGHIVRILSCGTWAAQKDIEAALDAHDWERAATMQYWDADQDSVTAYLLWCERKRTCSLLVRYDAADLGGSDCWLSRDVLEPEDGRRAWECAEKQDELTLPA